MSHEIPPVIRRAWTSTDSEATVEHVVHDDTTFERGLGDSGREIQHVSGINCPCCDHDELIRLRHVNPVDRDTVSYWCLMPNCRYFVADELSWATKPHPNYVPETPMQWDQTHECRECGNRWTETVTKGAYAQMRVEDGIVVQQGCDECIDRERRNRDDSESHSNPEDSSEVHA